MMSRAGGLIFVGLMDLALVLFPKACVAREGQHCTPSSCGNIRNISYPFRLNSDLLECGDRFYELPCVNNHTTLYMCGGKYYVQEISYVNQTMLVVDASLDDKDSCSILPYSFTNNNSSCLPPYFLVPPVSGDAEVVVVNCTQPVKSSVYIDVTPCINSSSSPKTNLYALYGHVLVSDVHEQCSILVEGLSLFSMNSSTGGQLSIIDIHHELLKGFHLQYYGDYIYYINGNSQDVVRTLEPPYANYYYYP